jgi:hypothetical protein
MSVTIDSADLQPRKKSSAADVENAVTAPSQG